MHMEAEILSGTERPAYAGQCQANLLVGQIEAGRHLVAIDVQPLGGHVQVDATVVVRNGHAGFGAEECLVLHAHLVGALDGHKVVTVGGRLVAMTQMDSPDDVAVGMDGIGGLGQRRIHQGFGGLPVHDNGR